MTPTELPQVPISAVVRDGSIVLVADDGTEMPPLSVEQTAVLVFSMLDAVQRTNNLVYLQFVEGFARAIADLQAERAMLEVHEGREN